MPVIKRLSDIDSLRSNENESEGGSPAQFRHDIGRRAVAEPGTNEKSESEDLTALIMRVSVTTISELLIAELQKIRSLLHSEGERIHREITGYAGLSQSAVATMSVITETLSQLRPQTLPPRNR